MPGTGLQQVSADGGDLTTLVAPEPPGEQDFHDVTFLPDGRGLLYALDRGSGLVDTIPIFTGEAEKVILHLENETLRAPMYAGTGHIVDQRTTNNAGIWAVPIGACPRWRRPENRSSSSAQSALPSVSRDGTLLFCRKRPRRRSRCCQSTPTWKAAGAYRAAKGWTARAAHLAGWPAMWQPGRLPMAGTTSGFTM